MNISGYQMNLDGHGLEIILRFVEILIIFFGAVAAIAVMRYKVNQIGLDLEKLGVKVDSHVTSLHAAFTTMAVNQAATDALNVRMNEQAKRISRLDEIIFRHKLNLRSEENGE